MEYLNAVADHLIPNIIHILNENKVDPAFPVGCKILIFKIT